MFQFLVVSLGILLSLAVMTVPKTAQADYPEKDIDWIVPFSPGGGYDVWSRILTRSMQAKLPRGAKVIVKNVTGAAGRVGTLTLYNARPDGYSVGVVDVAGLIPYQVAVGKKKAGYDLNRFSWIGVFAEAPWIIAVRQDSPLRSLKDVEERGKDMRWGALGYGETHWLTGLITTGEMGIPYQVVLGYKGASELIPALLREDFDVAPILSTTALRYVQSGDIRPIAVLADKRFSAYPDTPTAKEQGFPISAPFVRVATAPPETPKQITGKLENLLLGAMEDPEVKKWAVSSGRSLEIVRPGGSEAARAKVEELFQTAQKYKKKIAEVLNR
jgi:tripartite-type tricarboxylate transporter receptor subunit TctC